MLSVNRRRNPFYISEFKAETEQLRSRLEDLEKPTGIGLLAHSDMLFSYMVLSISNTPFEQLWITDSIATNYVTNSSKYSHTCFLSN